MDMDTSKEPVTNKDGGERVSGNGGNGKLERKAETENWNEKAETSGNGRLNGA